VSPLLLFGRQQDFAYQQEVDGSPGKRHHVRFWRCPDGWMLPGGHQVDWLAGATFDRAVGLSLFTMQITHKIDADIDIERDYVTGSVVKAVPGTAITMLKDFTTGYHSRNGGGDSIHTDGDLPVIELPHAVDEPYAFRHRQERPLRTVGKPEVLEDGKESRRRPLSVLGSAALVLAGAATSVVLAFRNFARPGGHGLPFDTTYDRIGLIAAVVVLVGQILLMALTLQGRQLTRLILMSILLFSVTVGLIDRFSDRVTIPLGTDAAAVALEITALILLSSNAAREYAVAARQLRHDTRAAIADHTRLT
jgi:hypothetical protein